MRIDTTRISRQTRINADLLIPGRGEPLHHATLIFEASQIVYVGHEANLPSELKNLKPQATVPVLLPGLWDCHVHFFGTSSINVDTMSSDFHPAEAGARTARDLAALLNAGFTSVRELAGCGIDVAPAVKDGWLPGPNIYSSATILSITAGHGDARSLDLCMVHDRMSHGLPFHLCDGPDECIKAVRTQVRRGASVIKVATSGGVASPDDPYTQQFSEAELKAIVAEADRNDLVVAAHCHGIRGVMAALKSGCKTIEHGSYLNDEAIHLMVQNGTHLVATRTLQEYSLQHREIWSDEAYAKLLGLTEANRKSYEAAIKAGVRLALGTDLGISSPRASCNHGTNGSEFQYAVDAGMTPLQAIEAGTANGPETLGKRAPKSGQLRPGYDADVIAMDVDPLRTIGAMGDPLHITHVWRGGKLFKCPGKAVGLVET